MSDYVGLKLGNYRIVRLIGRGGFAHVYQGEHIYLKTPAAIKVLNMHLMKDALEHFLCEARIIASLEHPHIVRVLEFGVEGITPYLVMNYAKNGTVRQQHPRNSSLAWTQILSYSQQVADALQYAHNHGIIHRDIKPENMLLDKNQQIQLSDFGLAVLAQNLHTHSSNSAGTTAYMAPEQLQGHPCAASDQYALAIVVYEWLCASLPFTGPERAITIHHLYDSPPSLRTKRPDLSPALEEVILKALAKEPQARFATIREFAQALEQASTAEMLLNTGKESTTPFGYSSTIFHKQRENIASPESAHPMAPLQEPGTMSAAYNFFPQLPLLVYESSLTNKGRILQPSLETAIPSQEEFSLPSSFSSQDDLPLSSQDTFLPPLTPAPQRFSDLSLSTTQTAQEKQQPLSSSVTSSQPISKHQVLITLMSIALIGFIILAGMFTWTHLTSSSLKHSVIRNIVPPLATHTIVTKDSTPAHQQMPTPDTHKSPGTLPATTTQSGTLSGNTPSSPVTASTPAPTTGTQSAPTPTQIVSPTPTPIPPLSVEISNPPASAPAGSIITITTQTNRTGVTITLNGKVRSFGQQSANSQGGASFQIKVPLHTKRMYLTATALASNGDQAKSLTQTVLII